MPRCLMPKKWKTAVANECSWDYDSRRPSSPPQPQQQTKNTGPQWEPPVTVLLHHHQHHHHQQHHAWGPSSPPAGATAPSPPPCCTGTAFHYLTAAAEYEHTLGQYYSAIASEKVGGLGGVGDVGRNTPLYWDQQLRCLIDFCIEPYAHLKVKYHLQVHDNFATALNGWQQYLFRNVQFGLFGSFTVWACSVTFSIGTNLLEYKKVSRVLMWSFSRRPHNRQSNEEKY
ncbi:hypothetical protein QTP88_015855 [Uroleucon formosanum]